MRRALVVLLLAVACHAKASADAPVQPTVKTGTIRFDTPRGPWVVKVEVVANDRDRNRGLMFRRELAPDAGMLFVFPEASEHTFWMHNTLLSLDMVFLGEDRSVVGVLNSVPPQNDLPRTVGKPSRYQVELLAGQAAAHAIGPGTRVAFIDVPE